MPNQWGCFTQKSVTLDGNNRPPMSIGGCERISMTVVEAFDPNEIRLTDNAASKVRALVEDEGNPGLKLRVYITGGGCSGFQYGFSFDESVSEDDMVVERNGATALIDAMRTNIWWAASSIILKVSRGRVSWSIIRMPPLLVAAGHLSPFNRTPADCLR